MKTMKKDCEIKHQINRQNYLIKKRIKKREWKKSIQEYVRKKIKTKRITKNCCSFEKNGFINHP